MDRNIGVIIPSKWEIPLIFRSVNFSFRKDDVNLYVLPGTRYHIAFSGWGIYGGVNKTVDLLSKNGLDTIFVVGFCIGLSNALNTGDIIIADSVSDRNGTVINVADLDDVKKMMSSNKSSQIYHFGQIHSLPYTAVESMGIPGIAVDEESFDAVTACSSKGLRIVIAKTVVGCLPSKSLRKQCEGRGILGELICGLPTMLMIKCNHAKLRQSLSNFLTDYRDYDDQ
jgi:hypothetical protein